MKAAGWLATLALALLLASAAGWPPVIDEESYLDLAEQLDPARPYAWRRDWQPWAPGEAQDNLLYAHPPLHLLHVALWRSLLPMGPGLRLAAGLPWALLLGWALASLAARSGAGQRGLALVITSPVLVLGVQSSLMIDLPVVALGAAAVAAWQRHARGEGPGFGLAAGLLLGLAAGTKYPALSLAPLMAFDALRRRRPGALLTPALAFFAVLLAVQGYVAWCHGRLHLPHVLSTAGRIDRGPLSGRAVGTLIRLALLGSPLLAALLAPRRLALALALGGGAALTLRGSLDPEGLVAAGAWAAAGAALLGLALGADAEEEGPLLKGWLVLVLLGVVLGHNYVGGRYLLPAALPLGLLLARRARACRETFIVACISVSAALALALSLGEARYARAAEALAVEAHRLAPAPGAFTGEWTFRWALRERGWRFTAGEALPPGTRVLRPRHASPGPLPSGLRPRALLEGPSSPWPRLVDLEEGVGYHAETLGPLPLGLTGGPLEAVEVLEAP